GTVAAQAFLEHPGEDGDVAVDVVVDADLYLPRMQAMEATRILHQRALPRDRHREKERVEPRVVESFTDVAAGRDEQPRFSVWDGRECCCCGASLGRSHPAAEDDDVAGGAQQAGRKELKMVRALGA